MAQILWIMKYLLIFILLSQAAYAQETLSNIKFQRDQYKSTIKLYEDSIKIANGRIVAIEKASLQEEIKNTGYIWGVIYVGHPIRDHWTPKTANIIGKAIYGDSVQIVGFNSNYYKITYKGVYGWVYKGFVKGGEDLALFKATSEKKQEVIKKASKAKSQKRAEQLRLEREKRESEEFLENYRKRKSSLTRRFGSSTTSKILNNQVWIGMTREMLKESRGAPNNINRTVTANNVSEQWVYGSGNYVYLDNDIVTSYQD